MDKQKELALKRERQNILEMVSNRSMNSKRTYQEGIPEKKKLTM
jgi:hypothetical protein